MIEREVNLPKHNSFFLFGPRQTGKTTVLRKEFGHLRCLNFDLLKSEHFTRLLVHPQLLRSDIETNRHQIDFVIIDEVQRIPNLLNEVHAVLESPNPPVFILSGSSARKLKREGANLLAGRAWTREMFPLTVHELGHQFHLLQALQFGTLPPVYLNPSPESRYEILASYVDTYLREEIEIEAKIRNLPAFVKMLCLAAEEDGQSIHYSNIASATGISPNTVKEYFHILSDTFVGRFLLPMSSDERQRLARTPKFYFFDQGVRRAILRLVRTPVEPIGAEFGRLFESFIINQVFAINRYLQKDLETSYYRTEAGAEVDLILEQPNGKIYAVEIKSSQTPRASEFKGGFNSFKQLKPEAECLVVSTTPHTYRDGEVTVYSYLDFFEKIRAI